MERKIRIGRISMEHLQNCPYGEFHEALEELGGISKIWLRVSEMLAAMSKELSGREPGDEAMKLLAIAFSLIDDGNTAVPLDGEMLFEKWMAKWNGICVDMEADGDGIAAGGWDGLFRGMIGRGLERILGGEIGCLVADADESGGKPFTVKKIDGTAYLFPSRLFKAKRAVEDGIERLFRGEKDEGFEAGELEEVERYFEDITGIRLNEKQAEAVIAGCRKNMILTGGPGTGKTTAVCFLLWRLLSGTDSVGRSMTDYGIFLAAPSGKAAARLKESIDTSLSLFPDDKIGTAGRRRKEKLLGAAGTTIHKLLSYNPKSGGFSRDEGNRFPDESIFVVDEASMCDIEIFASLLKAIPDKARLFILGDADQLPSVENGAVFSELVEKIPDCVVRLVESNRFKDDSQIGALRSAIIDGSESFRAGMEGLGKFVDGGSLASFDFSNMDKSGFPVFFSDISGDREGDREIDSIVENWTRAFHEGAFLEAARGGIDKERPDKDKLKKLWRESFKSKILCAERKGRRGVERMNETAIRTILKDAGGVYAGGEYFAGEILILDKNQRLFDLSNGDCGIVVEFKGDRTQYFMVERKGTAEEDGGRREGIFRLGDFIFYPVHILPSENLSPAYAMTIHKAQGSGYGSIMVFLPKEKGHPLLNNQIFYTAVTRTEGLTCVVASEERMNEAKRTRIERDTKLEI